MYPDIEQRDFYPQLNGLSKIIKKDYLKIQGPQRSHKNCVNHFFSELLGRPGDPFISFSFPLLFFQTQGESMYRKISISSFPGLERLAGSCACCREWPQLQQFARNRAVPEGLSTGTCPGCCISLKWDPALPRDPRLTPPLSVGFVC